jgi:hypothetical protein
MATDDHAAAANREWSDNLSDDPRERLEQLLRRWLDDDDATTVVQIVLAQGWHPPGLGLTVSNEDFRARNDGRA